MGNNYITPLYPICAHCLMNLLEVVVYKRLDEPCCYVSSLPIPTSQGDTVPPVLESGVYPMDKGLPRV